MKQAIFYLLSYPDSSDLSAAEKLACETEQQAFNIDEVLWATDPDDFVPVDEAEKRWHMNVINSTAKWAGRCRRRMPDTLAG